MQAKRKKCVSKKSNGIACVALSNKLEIYFECFWCTDGHWIENK